MLPPAETASRAKSRRLNRGVANMLVATFAFAVMNVFVKQLERIPAMEIVFFRCFVSGLICGVEVSRRQLDWKGNNHTLLIARGALGTLALFTFFITLQHLPLATAVTIQYLSPIFTALIGVFVLHELVPARQWLFYGIAFVGVFVLKGFDSGV
ncbi:MAG: DMT family transporter [Bryobacteraceae bacterium]